MNMNDFYNECMNEAHVNDTMNSIFIIDRYGYYLNSKHFDSMDSPADILNSPLFSPDARLIFSEDGWQINIDADGIAWAYFGQDVFDKYDFETVALLILDYWRFDRVSNSIISTLRRLGWSESEAEV